MYYVVTGAAGFVGANLVKALNQRGIENILVPSPVCQIAVILALDTCRQSASREVSGCRLTPDDSSGGYAFLGP